LRIAEQKISELEELNDTIEGDKDGDGIEIHHLGSVRIIVMSDALETAELRQYRSSAEFMERFLRHGPRVLALKKSIRQYLEVITGSTSMANVVVNDISDPVASCLDSADVAKILTTNDQMLTRHIEAWKERHQNADQLSNDDIFFRRGLSLQTPRDEDEPYREWDFINSYSIALSAPEKFAQMQNGRIAALVSGDWGLFDGRVLFFSPFVPMMDVGQLEAGVIPSENPLPIKYQGNHGGILEYIIGEQPGDLVD
jgi:hypothetical protein